MEVEKSASRMSLSCSVEYRLDHLSEHTPDLGDALTPHIMTRLDIDDPTQMTKKRVQDVSRAVYEGILRLEMEARALPPVE